MQLLTLPTPPNAAGADAATEATSAAMLVPMVRHIGADGFGAATLVGLNEAQLHAASWSVYQLWPERPPTLHLSASLGVADTTRDCFGVYRDGLYRLDRSFDGVRRGDSAVLRMHADEAPSQLHRERIYRRHGMVERLSVVRRDSQGSLLAVNLYHHVHQGRFAEGEWAAFIGAAPLLLAAVQRHLDLTPVHSSRTPADAPAPPDTDGERERLRSRCPALTPRELDVCERLLRGWSYDGIAADLGLSLASVKTYRARAFSRLGLHFRSELFALLRPGH